MIHRILRYFLFIFLFIPQFSGASPYSEDYNPQQIAFDAVEFMVRQSQLIPCEPEQSDSGIQAMGESDLLEIFDRINRQLEDAKSYQARIGSGQYASTADLDTENQFLGVSTQKAAQTQAKIEEAKSELITRCESGYRGGTIIEIDTATGKITERQDI